MTDPADDLLRDLRNELQSVAPSPAFAAAVRARVAGKVDALGARMLFWTIGGSVAAAAMIVAIGVWRSPAPPVTSAVPQTQRAATSAPESAVNAPGTPNVAPPAPLERPRATRPRRAPVAIAHAATADGPAIEVITNQREVIARVWEMAQRRGVVTEVAVGEVLRSQQSVAELVVAPLGVEPIVIEAQPRPEAPAASAPVIRKVVTVDTTRSER
jgi:hypothetical protein